MANVERITLSSAGSIKAVLGELKCPNCGFGEMHPTNKEWAVIKAFKVADKHGWWHQCLFCAGHYKLRLGKGNRFEMVSTPERYDKHKGWFLDSKRGR